jgi:hypothetical protein
VRYCLACHSTAKKKGDLDMERFTSLEEARRDPHPWQAVVEMLDNGEMPPRKSPQPGAGERRRLIAWARGLVDEQARARAGDPGRVVVRRLSNAEYDNTVRDLTGIDLRPARDFPADGAAGEGFTNAGDALVLSPTLLGKYLNAAKEVAAHAVLLPDGLRFSKAKTRRDWTDEALAQLRAFYAAHTSDGKLPLRPYLLATLRYRDDLRSGKVTPEAVAAREKLSPKYLRTLWQALTDPTPSFPLDRIRSRWRRARVEDTDALLAEVAAWQGPLWKFNIIGSYRADVQQEPVDPAFVESRTLRVQPRPAPGQTEVVLRLNARQLVSGKGSPLVVWHRPRFEGGKEPPLLLRDFPAVADRFEVDYRGLFADTAKYLAAAVAEANDPKAGVDALARKHGLDPALLARWVEVLAVEPVAGSRGAAAERWAPEPPIPLQLLTRKLVKGPPLPAINGWRNGPEELPVVISNSSDRAENVPGTVPPHKVTVHPLPAEFVAVAWRSPVEGAVRVEARVAHAHPACGNGIAWWLEHRRAERGRILDSGVLDVGQKGEARPRELKVAKGDLVVLAVGARDLNHACDLTAVDLTVTEASPGGRSWDLARDVADTILEGNPHADRRGNRDVWSFLKGSDPAAQGKPVAAGPDSRIPPGSVLARWRAAASDPRQQQRLGELAARVQALLTGDSPADPKHPDRVLYDALVSLDSPLLRGIDLPRRARPREQTNFGLERGRFGQHPLGKPTEEASLVVPADEAVEIRLPAGVFRDRALVVEVRLDPAGGDGVVQPEATAGPTINAFLDVKAPCLALPGGRGPALLKAGLEEFRRLFPVMVCYPRVIPDDEIICLKLYHREDEPLVRLFLDDERARGLDRLWGELRHVSQYPLTESKNLPTFIGFVTQDGEPAKTAFFERLREPFRRRAEEFQAEVDGAAARQLDAVAEFAARAFRRPLAAGEKAELDKLYAALRKKGLPSEEAVRTTLVRVLVAPSFLFRVEQPAPGSDPRPVSDWELATRLSYFLWASIPDEGLRQAAAAGRLHEPGVLSAQVARMLKDPKVRGLATEFGAQWLHVRDVRGNREKNEKLFPAFDDTLRQALFEESVLFFQDLFQNDRPATDVLDSDATFLNEALARHYGIPGVRGPAWRRVEGVRRYGRGGVLGLGSVLTQQSGASRTSPVLRGNWVVETLLGDRLPRPPANVPRLPEEEAGGDGLTVRALVERHTRVAECAACHRRIDPFGFALEAYDPVGRLRQRDLGGRPLDTHARLEDGTEFDGIEGLRRYLLTRRGDVFLRHFCRKLAGYALGRSVTLSDHPLVDEMLGELKKHDYRLSTAVQAIARSKQFRYHRGIGARDEGPAGDPP